MFRLTAEPILFCYCFVYTVNMAVLPQFILDKLCNARYPNNTNVCKDDFEIETSIQKDASLWTMYYFLCSTVPSFFSVLFSGMLSDVIGRKVIMLAIPILSLIQNTVFFFTAYLNDSPLELILIGGVCVSIFGDLQGAVSCCYSHLADITSDAKEHRTMRMAILESCLFLAPAIGGILSGYLLQMFSYMAVYSLNLILNFLLLLYVTIFFKNIRQTEDSENTPLMTNEKWRSITYLLKVLKSLVKHKNRVLIMLLVTVYSFTVAGMWGEIIVGALYIKNYPFHASPKQVGLFFSIPGFIRGIGVILITQISHRWLMLSDNKLVLIGLFSHMITFLLFGLVRTFVELMWASICGLFIPVAMTTLRSMLTKLVSEEQYGTTLGVFMSLDVLMNVIMNFVGLQTYRATLNIYSGIIFFVVSFLDFVAIIFFIRVIKVSVTA